MSRDLARSSRYAGCLLGMATGDALGTTIEFQRPGTFEPLTDIIGGGPFKLEAGQWTDDTSMALCLGASLIECGGFDALDQMKRYVRWYSEGYMSSTARCFDIGNTVRGALNRFEETGDPVAGSTAIGSAGNGSIMRLAPVPMYYADDSENLDKRCAESSTTTHGARTCVDACRYFGGLIAGALQGASKDAILSELYSPVAHTWEQAELCDEIHEIAMGSFKVKNPPEIQGLGYVVKSLEAALWAFYRSDNFKDGALLAVNLGDDADTTGAVYGQIAGAYYGIDGIPSEWRQKIYQREMIVRMAEEMDGGSRER